MNNSNKIGKRFWRVEIDLFLKLLVNIKCSCGKCKVTLKSSDQYLAVEERAETRRLLPPRCSGVGGTLISVNKYSVGADHNWLLLRVTLQGKFFFPTPTCFLHSIAPRPKITSASNSPFLSQHIVILLRWFLLFCHKNPGFQLHPICTFL